MPSTSGTNVILYIQVSHVTGSSETWKQPSVQVLSEENQGRPGLGSRSQSHFMKKYEPKLEPISGFDKKQETNQLKQSKNNQEPEPL